MANIRGSNQQGSSVNRTQYQMSDRLQLLERLDYYYKIVSAIILAKQHPCSGLLPASTAITTHGNYTDAWVRDNVYSILAVYGLALAYRRLDDDQGRTYELEHACVKCMRGLLNAMMKQSDKVEAFKKQQSVENALHAKYNTATGETVVGDSEWGHLQLDATSLFVLILAQMTASGMHIIYTVDEVDFVQNLVFYIERAYRSPDFSLWERGNKINHGEPELNSSAIGMCTAALQAINGLNLFGAKGGSSSVIHVLPDEFTRNFTTLHSALPRESLSKEIDAGLLSVISYPAFAVHDTQLLRNTKQEIVSKLGGNYGFKRFLRDGHQTSVEDTSRLHYNPQELKVFENIECEWPLFYTYMILDGLFNGDEEQVEKYRQQLSRCLINSSSLSANGHAGGSDHHHHHHSGGDAVTSHQNSFNGSMQLTVIQETSPMERPANLNVLPPDVFLVPELYIVPLDKVEEEKAHPKSQQRVPNENVPLVWAQSLYLLGELVYENLLSPSDIDPLGRHMMPVVKSNATDVIVQIALISEDTALQQQLSTFGLESQTPDQVAPITIASPHGLKEAYSVLGANSKLGLSGRPQRPIGSLGTCKLYRVSGRLYAFTPQFMDWEEFYMTMDSEYLISVIESELMFVRNNWSLPGRPTMVMMLTHSNIGPMLLQQNKYTANQSYGRNQQKVFDFMMTLRTGVISNGVRVKLGRLHELVSTSCIQSLDFLTTKIEQGYLNSAIEIADGRRVVNWEQLLGGVKQRKKWDSKLNLGPEFSISKSAGASLSSSGGAGSLSKIRRQDSYELRTKETSRSKYTVGPPKNTSEFKLKVAEIDHTLHPDSPAHTHKRSHTYSQTSSSSTAAHTKIGDVERLKLKLGDSSQLNFAINQLSNSMNLYDQADLLYYISSCKGFDFVVHLQNQDGSASTSQSTVRELVQEVYENAMNLKMWEVVREAADMLKKVASSLTISVTDLLIRQTYITFGHGNDEYTLLKPVSPDQLTKIIYQKCHGELGMAPLYQELLLYLSSFIKSEPHLFSSMYRVRIHFIISAMLEQIQFLRQCDHGASMDILLKLSPMDIKTLLGYILRAKDSLCTSLATENALYQIPLLSPGNNGLEINLTVQSAGYYDGSFANIGVNGQYIVKGGQRGLNVAIVSMTEGSVCSVEHFDTWASGEQSDKFIAFVENNCGAPNGNSGKFLLISVRDEATERMTDRCKEFLKSLGSNDIKYLKYRDSWCMICQYLNGEWSLLVEHLQAAKNGSTPVIEHTYHKRQQSEEDVEEGDQFQPLQHLRSERVLPSKGQWGRRRKIEGALQRTPFNFYPMIHRMLERVRTGMKVGSFTLSRNPTVSEKTPEEISFALLVDSMLSYIDPAERMIAIECLTILYDVDQVHNNLDFLSKVDVLDIAWLLECAYQLHWDAFINTEVRKSIATEQKQQSLSEQDIQSMKSQYQYCQHKDVAKKLFIDLPDIETKGFYASAIAKTFGIKLDE
ncbi:hypothetical protein MP228_012480 [Amoeboaphelidium protococcarum]|nr:hypothetical protein MP228_012480 [Amoeboaphelidium protococcarum]